MRDRKKQNAAVAVIEWVPERQRDLWLGQVGPEGVCLVPILVSLLCGVIQEGSYNTQ